jgi:hypothetical protein
MGFVVFVTASLKHAFNVLPCSWIAARSGAEKQQFMLASVTTV